MASKTLLGGKIRRLRRAQALSQVALARQLGISASYLNLIEHNQRPVPLPLLLKFAGQFQVDIQALSRDGDARLLAELTELLGDPLFGDLDVGGAALRGMVESAPLLAQALTGLYRSYRDARDDLQGLADQLSDQAFLSTSAHELRTLLTNIRSFAEILQDYEDLDVEQRRHFTGIVAKESARLGAVVTQMLAFARDDGDAAQHSTLAPAEAVTEFVQAQENHFPALEEAGDSLRRDCGLAPGAEVAALVALLAERYNDKVERCATLPPLDRPLAASEADRPLLLGALEPASRQRFRLARRLAALACGDLVERLVENDALLGGRASALARRTLLGYVAGAILLPYDEFHASAQELRYDITALQGRFGASFEQVCHRLTTLRRVGAEGLPLHFLRIDIAGNLSKRFSASGLTVARFGGVCPRWNAHAAFLTPGRLRTQVSRLSDGRAFFDVACAVEKPSAGYGEPRSLLAVNIGCEAARAGALVYSDGLALDSEAAAVPVGMTCRLCDRLDCRQRAQEPILPSLRGA